MLVSDLLGLHYSNDARDNSVWKGASENVKQRKACIIFIKNLEKMLELKPISPDGIPNALEKATRYRLLNEPWQAESICRDILRTDPTNQQAIMTMILAITDQFEAEYHTSLQQAVEMISRLEDPYQQEYCRGLIFERQGTAALRRATPRSGYIAYEFLEKAMDHYEKAEKYKPAMIEDAVLRWNACARMIDRYSLQPSPEERGVHLLE